jgi:FKBP-type peptidyl-prolyl cis-trans isomerase
MLMGCSGSEEEQPVEEQAGYALGVAIGNNIKPMQDHIDFDALLDGLRDIMNDREPRMSPAEVGQAVQAVEMRAREADAESRGELMGTNLEEGQAFLADNRTKDGVVETPSGLQYVVLTQGDGPSPSATDRVTVHYAGTLLDGTEFDSSYERGEPASFALNGVIAGWTEGVQLMAVGSKFRFFIPANLAYGERGSGRDIGPNATLIFEVELLAIE